MTPPVFWPMLLYVEAGAAGAAGVPSQGLAPIESAIELMGGEESPGVVVPELLLTRGDLLTGLDASGAVVPPDPSASYRIARSLARRHAVRLSELRALTRLARSASSEERDVLVRDLRSLLDTFTEGSGTADLLEAREALAAASGI